MAKKTLQLNTKPKKQLILQTKKTAPVKPKSRGSMYA